MQVLWDFLLERRELSPGSARFEVEKKTIFRDFRKRFPDAAESEPALSFETLEPRLIKGEVAGDWRISLNPYTSILTFERIVTAEALERQVEVANGAVRATLRARLFDLDGFRFQRAMTEVLRNLPWVKDIKETKLTGDGGVDFRSIYYHEGLGEIRALGQVKRTTHKTTGPEIREFVGGAMSVHPRPDLAVFISFSGYTNDAIEAIRNSPLRIQKHTVEDVIEWQRRYLIGVRKREFELFSLDLNFWKEI